MDLVIGGVYTIKNTFFKFVNDPYLMNNHHPGYRPHYCCSYDSVTGLYWMIPFSSNFNKYQGYLNSYNQKIINFANEEKEIYKKKKLGFEPIVLDGKNDFILYLDMFPVSKDFVHNEYRDSSGHICFDAAKTAQINKHADDVLKLLKDNFPFSPTLPNIARIERIGVAYNS